MFLGDQLTKICTDAAIHIRYEHKAEGINEVWVALVIDCHGKSSLSLQLRVKVFPDRWFPQCDGF
jgi:hypothetical protein